MSIAWTWVSTWGNGSNGTKNSAKVFSFVDSSDSSCVKSDCGHHHRGVAPEGATRAATDREVKDRKHPLYRCSGRTYLGNRLSPSSWPIDSQNRWRDRTQLESNPPTSQRSRSQGDSLCLSQLGPGEGHGEESAERPRRLKKRSHGEQRAAWRAALGLPPQ